VRACAAVTASVMLAAACGWTPADEQVLTKFFEQSRVYDKTRLAAVATVVFDPRIEGVVDRFTIVERTDEPLTKDRISRRVTVEANIRSAAGQMNHRKLVVTLEGRESRWIVTGFR
jgi:hypothetical protein